MAKSKEVSIVSPTVSFGEFINGVIEHIPEAEQSTAGFPYWDYDAGSELRGVFLGVENIDVKNVDSSDPDAPDRKRLPCVRIKTGDHGGFICAASTLVQDMEHVPAGSVVRVVCTKRGGKGKGDASKFQIRVVADPERLKQLLGEKG